MGKNQTDCHSKLLGLTNNKVKRKYGIVLKVRELSWIIPQLQSSRTGFQRKVLSASPHPPPSPAFIDKLSSCLRDGTQESTSAVFVFQNQMHFFFQYQIFCIWSLHLAWHLDWHAWSFFLLTFIMWTENKLFSRKGIGWKQNDNLITQYEHE